MAALAIRLAVGLWWQSRLGEGVRFGFPDSESYWVLAQSIVRGEPYQFGSPDTRVFRTPGYPLLLAGLFRLIGDDPPVIFARGLSAVLGTLAVAGVYWLARQLFDRRAATIALLMATVYPGAIAMSVVVLSEAPFCALMLLQLIFWTYAWRCEGARCPGGFASLAGVVAGLATLVRPSWLLFTPLALLAAVAASRWRWRHASIGLVMLASLVLTMLPWWIRNYMVAGRFVPTTLQVGASLYDGWNPRATGASDMSGANRIRDRLREATAARQVVPSGTFEYRVDRHLHDSAIRWAWGHPGAVIRLAGVKVTRTWNFWPNEPGLRSWPLRLIVMFGYVPLLVWGIWGTWKFVRRGWAYVLCVLPAVYFTLLHAVFVGSIRYRQPAMLAIIVLAAGVAAAYVRSPRTEDRLQHCKKG